MKSRLLKIALIIVLGAVVYGGWHLWARPTRIVLVNYPEYLVARFVQSEQSPFVRLNSVKIENAGEINLAKYDFVLVWAHGAPFTEEIRSALRRATARGRAVFCAGATSAENDFTNLEKEDLQQVEAYLRHGGKANYSNFFTMIRHQIHGAKLFAPAPDPVKEIAADVFFHLEEHYFETLQDYQNFRVKKGLHKEGAPRVALFTSNVGPRNSGRDDLDSLIVALENQGLNVFPVDGYGKRLAFLDSIQPHAIVSFPHGRFIPGRDGESTAWLKNRNIPLLSPIKVFREYDEWIKDQRGMDGGALAQGVVMPELDGAIEPLLLSALFPDGEGGKDFKALPGRAQRIARRVANWVELQTKPNSQKRVTIVYLKGPGQNALVAQGMEVLPSLYAVLKHLRDLGYSVEGLPKTLEEFGKLVHKQGMVPGPYAQGTLQRILQEGNPQKIPVPTYKEWAKKALGDSLWRLVVQTYGEAPGPYLSITEGEQPAILVNRIVFGNVQIMPQPLPGYGENEFALIHGVQVPPPHPYIAAYLWAAHGFASDAIIHFGTHGSFEFLPSKQTALSDYDWPVVLLGDMPHGYVYTINNIGEAMMAKRRSKAVMLSHLTPPFMSSDLYGDLQQLHDKIHHYLLPDLDPTNKAVYGESIKELVLRTNLHKDLELDSLEKRELQTSDLDKIHNYIHSIEAEKIGQGLYVLGRPYLAEEAKRTAELMHVDAVAYSKMELDLHRGLLDSSLAQNRHAFTLQYLEPAQILVQKALNGEEVVSTVLDSTELKWVAEANRPRPPQAMAAHPASIATNLNDQEYGALVARVITDTAALHFIEKWESRREYQRLASLLDPVARRRFDEATKVIPEMRRLAQMLDRKGMDTLLRLSSDTAVYRRILSLARDTSMQKAMVRRREAHQDSLRTIFSSPSYQTLWQNLQDSGTWQKSLPSALLSLDSLHTILTTITQNLELLPASAENISTALPLRIAHFNTVHVRQKQRQEEHKRSALTLAEALGMVTKSQRDLLASTGLEMASIANMLAGGFISPSPGGDPVINPEAVPTGRNFYSINAENTPTRESYKIAQRLMEAMLNSELQKNGTYPRKVGISLWGGEFVRDQGTTLAQALVLMGIEPVWNSRGRMHDLKLIPSKELGRPRIDVVIQTSGQFRDMAASRVYLLNRAVRMATEATNDSFPNFVRQGSLETEAELIKGGEIAPARAARISRVRTFGGVNGNYGTGIMGLVESGDKWENEKEIQDRYILNMGAIYDEEDWGAFDPGAFRAALRNTEVVLHSRSSNTTGPISLDHTYEFMGGLLSAIRSVNGKDARALFTDTRNRFNPRVQEAKEAIWQEARTTILNPKFVKHMTEEGESAADFFAESVRNTYGWEVMRPDLIDDELWQAYYETFVQDKLQTGIRNFMQEKNPFAFQEITAVMLETIRKGYWDPGAEVVAHLAVEHAKWVAEHGAGCSGFVCDNSKLREFIVKNTEPALQKQYNEQLSKALQSPTAQAAVKMQKEEQSLINNLLPTAKTAWWMGALLLIIAASIAFLIHKRSKR